MMDAEILDKIIALTKERDELRQQLDEIGKQEPKFLYFTESGADSHLYDPEFVSGDQFSPLYAKPLPAEPAVSVPDGFVLMPEYRPTKQMHESGIAAVNKAQQDGCASLNILYKVYYEACAHEALCTSTAPSHSQPSADTPEMDLYNAATSVVRAIENSTGYEPSISVRARAVDNLSRALQIYLRCPSHESDQTKSDLVKCRSQVSHGNCACGFGKCENGWVY